MFGFSFPKFLLLAAVIAVVWYGFKMAGRKALGDDEDAPKGRSPKAGGKSGGSGESADEMVKCSVCGTYVPASGVRGCDRDDCPFGK